MPAFLDYLDCGKTGVAVSATFTTAVIPFNFTFASAPVVSVSIDDGGHVSTYAHGIALTIRSVSTTGFTIVIDWTQGSKVNATYNINWTAILLR